MARKSDRELQDALARFATLPPDEQREVMEAMRAVFAEQRRAECEASGGHVLVDNARECAHCWTPYSDILREQQGS